MNGITELNSFGLPLLQRKAAIEKQIEATKRYRSILFMGNNIDLPEIDLRIQIPVYRLANGRTRTMQLEYLALHQDLPSDFFVRDHDSVDAQMVQHKILSAISNEEGLFSSFKDGTMNQTEPIICTRDGVVVNGNRRLCVWRSLYYGDKDKYKSFETVRVAVLPECDEKAIRDLEKRLQIQNQMRADYRWHSIALMADEEIENGTKDGEVAKSFGMSTQQLRLTIEAMRYAATYLERIGAKNEWSRVDKDSYAFEEMVKGRRKFTTQGDKELFEATCFKLIENGSQNGRLYQVIQDVAANLTAIAQELEPKMLPVADDNDTVEDDMLSLLGGGSIEVDKKSKLATAITETEDPNIVKTTVNTVIETQKALKSEKNAANYLISQVSRASTYLQNAITNGFVENANIDGVEMQLETIMRRVETIQKWINERK